MAKKFERPNIEAIAVDPSTIITKLLGSKGDLLKSNVVIHFHDSDVVYEKFVIGDSNMAFGGLLSQFLKRVFNLTKEFPDSTFFDITLRGAACLQDVLVDLVRTSNLESDVLPRVLKDDFSSWIDPFAPNTFSVSVERDCYIKPLLDVLLRGSSILKSQLDAGISRCPHVYYVDIVKLDDNNHEVSEASRWIFADVPCGKDGGIGNTFVKFIQQDPAPAEINTKIRREPFCAAIKNFLLKDISSTLIFNASYNDCLREFNQTREVVSKWIVLPQVTTKLDTETYLSATAADVEYFKKFQGEEELIEVIPRIEVEEREFDYRLLDESRNRIVDDVNRIKSKIDDINKKLSKNSKFIEESEKDIAAAREETKNMNDEYLNSIEKNSILNSEIDSLTNEKSDISNKIEKEQTKIDDIQPVIEKLNNFCNIIEKEIGEKEVEHKRILSRSNELYAMGLDVLKKSEIKLEDIVEQYNSSKKDADHNENRFNNLMDIFTLEKLYETAVKDFNEFMSLEKDAKKDFPGICSNAENELNVLKNKVNLKEIENTKKLEEIPVRFKDNVQKIKKVVFGDGVLNKIDKDLENLRSELTNHMESEDAVKLRSIFIKNV
uniref:BTB domain-containing protein n=1 Tax=Strongyloides venezuelensis TaxID=75913 RepID=A0A0K0FVI5_STRVS